jgi:hypothetical protein
MANDFNQNPERELAIKRKLGIGYTSTILSNVAKLASWPTPTANDDNKSPEAHLAMKKRMGERDGSNANRTAITSLQVMAKASWPTPKASDGEGGRTTKTEGGGNSHLPIAAREAMRGTTSAEPTASAITQMNATATIAGSPSIPILSPTIPNIEKSSSTSANGAAREAWATPQAEAHRKSVKAMLGGSGPGLEQQAQLTSGIVPPLVAEARTSPTARDRHTMAKVKRGAGSTAKGNEIIEPLIFQAAKIDSWRTPTSSEQQLYGQTDDGRRNLASQVMAAWATPAERDYRYPNATSYQERTGTTKGEQLPNQVTHLGMAPSGSSEPTARRGALNPAFPSFLMGFPPEWEGCLPSYSAWRRWQDWIESLSDAQKAIVWGLCEDSGTP